MRCGRHGFPPREPRSAPACRPKWPRLRCWWRLWSPRVSNDSDRLVKETPPCRSDTGAFFIGSGSGHQFRLGLLVQAWGGVGEAGDGAKSPVLGQDREVGAAEKQRRGLGASGAPAETDAIVMRFDPA